MSHYTAKICVIGEFSVGKTSLVRRFTENRFDDAYLSTLGVRVSRKVLQLAAPEPLTLSMLVWDTAGGEAFSDVVRSYYRGAAGALLVCDLTRPESVTALSGYARDFRIVNPGAPLAILANKLDLTGMRAVSDALLSEVAAELAAPCSTGSARTGSGVEEAFQTLGALLHRERNVG